MSASVRLAAVAVAVAALAAGAVGGAMFERSRKPAAGPAADSRPEAAPDGKPGPPAAGEAPQLEWPAMISKDAPAARAELQAENAKLKARVAELEKQLPKEKTKEDKIAIAKEILECIRKGKRDPEAFRKMLKLIGELDPAMGPFFLERLADPDEPGEKNPLYDLALASGGPEVAEWALANLTNPGTDDDVRQRILRVLGGGSKELFTIRNLPVTGKLADLGFTYATSSSADERRAGAGLLGGVNSVESRTTLARLASADAEWNVKETAIRSLALVGDKDTLTWLDTFRPSLDALGDWQKQRLQAAVDYAKETIAKRSEAR